MKKNELARQACEPGMARRDFLTKSLFLAVPALIGVGGPAAAAVSAVSNYSLPTLRRGSTVLSVRNYGALGDGIHDDTAAFQAAINALPAAGGTVDVPAGTYVIDPKVSVRLRSYMHLRLASGAILAARRNSEERAYVLMLFKLSDVEISGGQIVGDRDNHLGTTGEWGHGIQVLGSTRVTVRDILVSKCWGDGVCIGGAMVADAAPIPSRDVMISNIVSTGNRRHGMTIANAHGVKVYDSEFSSNRGLSFACGIDVEPSNDNAASSVLIENCDIRKNQANGIMVYKRVQGVTIKKCYVEENSGYGILTISPYDGYITQNRIRHNMLVGLMIRVRTDNYQVSGNYFRNNNASLHGIQYTTATAVPIVGMVDGNNGTGAHIAKTSDCTNIKVLTNYYAK